MTRLCVLREMWSSSTVRRTDYLLFFGTIYIIYYYFILLYFGYNFIIRISSRFYFKRTWHLSFYESVKKLKLAPIREYPPMIWTLLCLSKYLTAFKASTKNFTVFKSKCFYDSIQSLDLINHHCIDYNDYVEIGSFLGETITYNNVPTYLVVVTNWALRPCCLLRRSR